MTYPEPSRNDHGAPWNESDDGECDCERCCRDRRRAWREERRIDEAEYRGGQDAER